MKVYLLWVKTINTQNLQIEYFLDLDYVFIINNEDYHNYKRLLKDAYRFYNKTKFALYNKYSRILLNITKNIIKII